MRLRALLALACALLIAAPAAALAAPAGKPADAMLDRALRQLVKLPGGPPGVAAVVQRGSDREFHTAGVARVGTRHRWRVEDHMRIASVAKAFSGAAVLGLVDEGALALADPVRKLLPWLPAAWGEVTLGEALHHTSGLPDYSQAPVFQEFFNRDPHAYVSPQALIGYVAGEPLEFAAGSAYRYSNTDNIVAGLVVAAATGRNYSLVLRRSVYGPLGMTATTLPVGFRLPAPHVRGYLLSPPEPPLDATTLLAMAGAWASGGIQSTPSDLNRFIRGYIGGRLFGPATRAQQLRFVKGHSEPPGPGVNSAGLAVFRYRTECGTVYGHTGNIPGFTQFTAATPDGSRSVVVSVNAQVTPDAADAPVRAAFAVLRRAYGLAVCAALARG